jgi:hypothetical protein
MKQLFIVLFLVCIINLSCDHGLAPLPSERIEQGITGTIYYKGTFPTNITAHYFFASKVFRRFRDFDEILGLVFQPDSIQLYPELPKHKIDSISYRFVLPPAVYKYIAIAQAHGDMSQMQNWKIVGVYSSDSMRVTPDEVFVEPGKFVENVNIYVDYDSLPPQPFDN